MQWDSQGVLSHQGQVRRKGCSGILRECKSSFTGKCEGGTTSRCDGTLGRTTGCRRVALIHGGSPPDPLVQVSAQHKRTGSFQAIRMTAGFEKHSTRWFPKSHRPAPQF